MEKNDRGKRRPDGERLDEDRGGTRRDAQLLGDFDLDGVVTPADVAAFVKAWYVLVTTGGCS